MAKRKQYTADELCQLNEQLREHGKILFASVGKLARKAGAFDGACKLRDEAQKLASTLLAMQNIDVAVQLKDGWPRFAPCDLKQCGLEEA